MALKKVLAEGLYVVRWDTSPMNKFERCGIADGINDHVVLALGLHDALSVVPPEAQSVRVRRLYPGSSVVVASEATVNLVEVGILK